MPLSRVVHTYTDIPLPKAPPMPQTTYVYDRPGRMVITLHAGVNRTEVPLSKIADSLKEAVFALEDKDFYRQSGVNSSSIAMIWHDFMVRALTGTPVIDFAAPSFAGFDQQPERVIPLPPPPKPTPSPLRAQAEWQAGRLTPLPPPP
jgi:membrane peptidoglycan carboxypeptidase